MTEITNFPHLDEGTRAAVNALGNRLAPGVLTWTDLFAEDAVLEAKFDGSTVPFRGRQALDTLARALAGIIHFESVHVEDVIDGADGCTVVYTSTAIFTRVDLRARFRRSYVSIAEMDGGRIARLREFGGPLEPMSV